MRILHTSDWHLGHRLHEQSQVEEHHLFLAWLIQYIKEQTIDLILISGDIFDTGVPSTQSQRMYYDFLIQLRETPCKQVVITGGNHDSPGTINAPKALLKALSIHVIGKATEDINDEIFKLNIEDESIIIAAVPYLRDQDIRKAVSSESFDEINMRYKKALTNHYAQAAEACLTIQNQDEAIIAMGHLFAVGGQTSDSEQTIYVGNQGDIGVEDLPQCFDYVALGHLHKPQKVGNKKHIRYCGSPVILSFSEINYQKQFVEIEINKGKIQHIKEIEIPRFRSVYKVKGSVEECIQELQTIGNKVHDLRPWVEVIIDDEKNNDTAYPIIQKEAEHLDLEVLKVTLLQIDERVGIEQLKRDAKHIKELSPMEVFQLKCKEQAFDLANNPEVFDAFNEIWQMAKND